jgi:homoserine O-acetyltransferase/O-succinyltransferase
MLCLGHPTLVVRAGKDTRGHLTTGFAKFWKEQVRDFLETAPRRGM